MIQINKELTDSTGGPVPTGTQVRFDSNISRRDLKVTFPIFFYKNQTAWENDKSYVCVELSNSDYSFTTELTLQEYSSLEIGGAATLFHNKVKTYLISKGFNSEDLEIIL